MFLFKIDVFLTKNFEMIKFEIIKKKMRPNEKMKYILLPENKSVITIQKLKNKTVPSFTLLYKI